MEEQIKQKNPTLHRYLFTVTTFSKLLAMFLFIVLPFVGFYLGMKYQQKISVKSAVLFIGSSPAIDKAQEKNGILIESPKNGNSVNRNFVLSGKAPRQAFQEGLVILIDGKDYWYPEFRGNPATISSPPFPKEDGSYSIPIDLNGNQVIRVVGESITYEGISLGEHTFQVNIGKSPLFGPEIVGPTITLLVK